MGLLAIPPYLLTGDRPPSARGPAPGFHQRSYAIPEPIDFPRELFVDVLVEHARLLETHGTAVLQAPVGRWGPEAVGDPEFLPLSFLDWTATVLVGDGTSHEIHKRYPRELSYIVQRCRGIVRRLMLAPPEGLTHVVVVARDVASMHLVRGVEPRRAGDSPRLEVVERNLVVEPWDQWHQDDGEHVRTWWRTPIGELVVSRVVCPAPARKNGETVEALLALYDATLRSRFAAYGRANPAHRRLAILQTSGDGEELLLLDRRDAPAFLDDFPQIVEALRAVRPGLDAVVVDGYGWAALQWQSSGALDAAVPPALYVRCKERDERDAILYARLPPKTPPKIELPPSNAETLAALPPSILRAARRRRTGILAACCVVSGLATIPPLALFAHVARSPDFPWGPSTLVVLAGAAFLFACSMLVDHVRGTAYVYRGNANDVRAVVARPPAPPEQDVRRVWMARLARRLSHLEHLVALDAPEFAVEHSHELVHKAIRELEPSDAQAVLRAWPRAVKHLEAAQSRKGEAEKPN